MKINGTVIDPDIELERDPYGMLSLFALATGLTTLFAGWWLGRRASAK